MQVRRCLVLFLSAFVAAMLIPRLAAADTASSSAASNTATISGSVVDTDGGLPIPGAAVTATCAGQMKSTSTGPDGSFSLPVPSGYCDLLITAPGYQATRWASPIAAGSKTPVRVALTRISSTSAARTIGRIVVASQSAIQTSSTINAHVDPSVLQTQNYMRAGDALISVPGVNTFTSSSLGDDLSVSLRGFESSETATLLDGHPIGPIGAQSGGFDYQDSPFWGIRDVETIFGSGATGIYGQATIAGAVNFLSINPTQQPHALIEQGVGSYGKLMTGVQVTGSADKLGYAFSHGVEGTHGLFQSEIITNSGLNGSDIRAATYASNTYLVSSSYTLNNDLGKLTYAISPRTNLTLTAYSATSWDDKSGNGDNDFLSYQQNLYTTLKGLAANGGNSSVCISSCGTPSEVDGNCSNNTQAALADTPAGFACLKPTTFAADTSGPSGGHGGPWQAIRNQDYHARISQGLGIGQVNLDGYIDRYGLDYNRADANQSFHTDFYTNSGFLFDDEFALALHNLAFGYNYQHQIHTGDTFPGFDQNGNEIVTSSGAPFIVQNQAFFLNENSVFVRDDYTPNTRFAVLGNFWVKHSASTGVTSFDPRLTFRMTPDANNTFRLTGGRSNSEPDPSLLFAAPSYNTTPANINPVCGGQLNSIGSVSNPGLLPETASDAEFSYGRRVGHQDTVQIDLYNTYENNALFGANLPLSALGKTQVPPSLITAYLQRIANFCHSNPTTANLAVGTVYNAAAARYRGIEVTGIFHVLPMVTAEPEYDVQSSTFVGVPDSILMSNVTIINGSQIVGIPLHKANLGLDYSAPKGFDVELNGHYIGDGNQYNRPHFTFVNGSVSQQFGHVTAALGVNNIFNTVAQRYGYFGLGTFIPENKFGTDQNAFDQSVEQFGLPPTQLFFTATYRV